MRHLFFLLTFFSVCASAQAENLCGHKEKRNLSSRQGVNGMGTESFTYDEFDRLIEVSSDGGILSSETEYEDNGNISYKSEVGTYFYSSSKPHAVEQVNDSCQTISSASQQTSYNAHGKTAYIEEGNSSLSFFYGPDKERWQTTMMRDGEVVKTITFLGDYERVDSGGVQREYWYVADGVILYRETPQIGQPSAVTPLYALTDNLSSYVRLYTENGTAVFSAGYDAWGRQTARQIALASLPSSLSAFTFHRGYTGHEMLPAFGLINMNAAFKREQSDARIDSVEREQRRPQANGRLYDPAIARFLSPDNYVQLPDNAQNFNRYSYCLNNPLKYTDPSGEIYIRTLLNFFSFAYFNLIAANVSYSYSQQTNPFNPFNWNWHSAGTYFSIATSALNGLATFGVLNFGISGIIPNGLLQAGINIATNGLSNVLQGEPFFNGWVFPAASGFITGAISGYAMANTKGLNNWWGNRIRYNRTAWSLINTNKPDYTIKFEYLKSLQSINPNDCVPLSLNEIENVIGGDRTYFDFLKSSKYQYPLGIFENAQDHYQLLKNHFSSVSKQNAGNLFNIDFFKSIKKEKGVINVFFKNDNLQHVDNLIKIRIFLNNPNLTKLFFRNTSYNGTFNNLEKIIEIFVVH